MNSYRNFFVALLVGVIFICGSCSSYADDVTGAIENGKALDGVVKGAETDTYTFKVSKGSSFIVSVSEKGAHVAGFMLQMKLKGPDNKLVDGGAQEFFYRSRGLSPAEGNWTVEISRADQGNAGGAYELNLLQAPGASGKPIKIGQSQAGSLNRGSVDVYTTSGAPDTVGQLTLTAKASPGFIPEAMVFGPDGAMLNDLGCSDSCTGPLPLMAPGTYTIMVFRQDQSDTKESYVLSLSRPGETATPPDAPGADNVANKIENAKPVSGTIKGSAINTYTFSVAKGSSFLVSLSEKGKHVAGFMTALKIIGPDNKIVDGGAQELYYRALETNPAEGNWTLEVGRDDRGKTGGDYELRLLQVPGVKGTPIKFKQPYTGSIIRGASDVYTFSGTPDVIARITVAPKEGKGFMPSVTVFAPGGEMVNGSDCTERCNIDVQMTELGNYTVMVGRKDQNDAKGVYALSVQRSDGKIEESPVNVSRILNSTVVPVNPDRTAAGDRPVNMYIRGMFLIFRSHEPVQETLAAIEGSPLTQLSSGDRSSDIRGAITAWKKAADQGNLDAQNRLGIVYAQYFKDKKYDSAAWYRQVIDQAHADPDVARAEMYLTGVGAGQDFGQARKLYLKAAEQGNAVAQFNLAVIYTLGLDAAPDFAAAAKWYGKAAEQGLIVAENNLAELYDHGQGVAQDYTKAVQWYQKAAGSGYPQALYNLAILAEKGHGLTKDAAQAKAWLMTAAEEGHLDAQGELNALEGRTKDALQLWKKSAALGNSISLRRLTEEYRKAGIPPEDYDDVLELYRNASNEINPIAFAGLADLFAKKEPPDNFEAYYWYSLVLDTAAKDASMPPDEKDELVRYASEKADRITKNLSAEQVAVAKWRINDRHPKPPSKEEEAAAKIYLLEYKATEEGRNADAQLFCLQAAHKGSADAQFMLGKIFEYGRADVLLDINKAIDYYKLSERSGLALGATLIGEIYQFGIGVPRDLDEAAKWYEMDASRGSKEAIDRLGGIYIYEIKGGGKKAVAMYEKAAAHDILEANLALGMIYLYGADGVPSDPQKALKWYLKAADKGHPTGAIQAAAILKDYEPHDYGRALKLVSSYEDPVAINNMAYMYEHGLGVKEQERIPGQVIPAALELYKKSADMCYGRAMYNIGRLIQTGVSAPEISAQPFEKNPTLARQWMERAVHYGSQAAAMWLYLHGPDIASLGNKIPPDEGGFPPKACPKEGQKQ